MNSKKYLINRLRGSINTDVYSYRGVLALKEIAAIVEFYNVTVSPCNLNSLTTGFAAILRIFTMISNCSIAEYFYLFNR